MSKTWLISASCQGNRGDDFDTGQPNLVNQNQFKHGLVAKSGSWCAPGEKLLSRLFGSLLSCFLLFKLKCVQSAKVPLRSRVFDYHVLS